MKKLEIKETQNITFDALCYLDSICHKHNITYYLAYGTLLGAVREHDFIPWDDDVDVWMKREDYNRFSQIISGMKSEYYFFQSVQTDPNMPAPAESRICINGTINGPRMTKKLLHHQGVWIDIFPLDYSIQDKRFLSKKTKALKTIQKLIINKHRSTLDYQSSWAKVKHILLSFFPYHLLVRTESRVIHSNSVQDTNNFIDYAASWAIGSNPLRFEFDSHWFNKTENIEFHGKMFPCPIGYKEILIQRYGNDYMTPIHDGRTPYPKFIK